MEQGHESMGTCMLKRNGNKTKRVGRNRNSHLKESVPNRIKEAKHGIVGMKLAMVIYT